MDKINEPPKAKSTITYLYYNWQDMELEILSEDNLSDYTQFIALVQYHNKIDLMAYYKHSNNYSFEGLYSFPIISAKRDEFEVKYRDKWQNNHNIQSFYPNFDILEEFISE